MNRLLLVCLIAGLLSPPALAQMNNGPGPIFGLSDLVTCVTATRDGKRLAWGNGEKQIGLLEFPSGKREPLLTGHTGIVSCLAFSPDGLLLASGGEDITVRLWDVATGKEKAVLTGHKQALRCVAFSPDGKTVASGAADDNVLLWDVATRRQKEAIKMQADYVVTFSPDGKTLALDHGDNVVLWDVAAAKESARFKEDTKSSIRSLAFRPDGQMLASACFDGSIRLWDRTTGTLAATLTGHTKPVYALCFSSDGKTLASGSADKTVQLWDVATGKEKTPGVWRATDQVAFVSFTAHDKVLIAAAFDLTIVQWNTVSGEMIAQEKMQAPTEGTGLSNLPPSALPPQPKPAPAPFLFGLTTNNALIFLAALALLVVGALVLGRKPSGTSSNKSPS
jgi:WD40 repeat protein